jgi:hypothetical protein
MHKNLAMAVRGEKAGKKMYGKKINPCIYLFAVHFFAKCSRWRG